MENLIEKLGWKKIAAGMVAFSIAFLIFVVFTFPKNPTRAPSSPENTTPYQANDPSSSNVPTASNLKSFSNKFIAFSYPQDLYLSVERIVEDGDSLRLAPVTSIQTYEIEIQVYDKSETSVERIRRLFEMFKYVQTSLILDGGKALELRGRVETGSIPLQEIAVVAERGEKIYKLQLGYNAETINTLYEEEFFAILSTVKLP